ncbi:MAG: mechanosensitive ion channel family protein, partial [Spirochaetaceae bacterium]|nr:mechanosensitive ion channel family protein [Spirochaetaceae bacterium]
MKKYGSRFLPVAALALFVSAAALPAEESVPAPPSGAGTERTGTDAAEEAALPAGAAQPGVNGSGNGDAAPGTETDGGAAAAAAAAVMEAAPHKAEGLFHLAYFWQRMAAALGILVVQLIAIWLIWHYFFSWLAKKIVEWGRERLKPFSIKKIKLLTVAQMLNIIAFVVNVLKYVVTAFQLFITLPVIFSLFPQTRHLASQLFGYILNPLKSIVLETIGYIPNLITIAVILWVMRYAIRALKFFAAQIERGRLVINGFYPDWTWPTFNILRALIYAFTVVLIYPYLPGSGSPIFQGVSVFVGIILSMGSSSAIGNIIAGMVITYMRPFKIGDRIKIGDITGFVEEKSLIVIKIRTHKNEYVTFPNTMILSSSITNYQTSIEGETETLILYADVTMNYQIPWRQVHEIMINAALQTEGIETDPRPFVLQTALDDYYARYQINAYTRDAARIPAIYSGLYQHIQDGFAGAGIDLTAPAYRLLLPPESHHPPAAARPARDVDSKEKR